MRVITEILDVCREIKSDRSVGTIFVNLEGEMNELYNEIWDSLGDDQTNHGEDGIVGEAVDVILCAVDIIYKDNPLISEVEISRIVAKKLAKWRAKYEEKA